MKRKYHEVRKISQNAYGVYSKDYGPEGGMHLIKTFHTEEECNQFVLMLIIAESRDAERKNDLHP